MPPVAFTFHRATYVGNKECELINHAPSITYLSTFINMNKHKTQSNQIFYTHFPHEKVSRFDFPNFYGILKKDTIL